MAAAILPITAYRPSPILRIRIWLGRLRVRDSEILAEAEPDLYRIFSQAVLADHRRLQLPHRDLDRCMTCDCAWENCPIWRLAVQLGVVAAQSGDGGHRGHGDARAHTASGPPR